MILSPVMKQSKITVEMQFMGTFWSTEKHLLDALGHGRRVYRGGRLFLLLSGSISMIKKIRDWSKSTIQTSKVTEYRSQAYMQVSWNHPDDRA